MENYALENQINEITDLISKIIKEKNIKEIIKNNNTIKTKIKNAEININNYENEIKSNDKIKYFEKKIIKLEKIINKTKLKDIKNNCISKIKNLKHKIKKIKEKTDSDTEEKTDSSTEEKTDSSTEEKTDSSTEEKTDSDTEEKYNLENINEYYTKSLKKIDKINKNNISIEEKIKIHQQLKKLLYILIKIYKNAKININIKQ